MLSLLNENALLNWRRDKPNVFGFLFSFLIPHDFDIVAFLLFFLSLAGHNEFLA